MYHFVNMDFNNSLSSFMSNSNFTSTPHQSAKVSEHSRSHLQDTGYVTASCSEISSHCQSSVFDNGSPVFPFFEVENAKCVRKSFRGKKRFDILSGLLSYNMLSAIKLVLRYLDYFDRLKVVQVCDSWNTLQTYFPSLFIPPYRRTIEKEQVNSVYRKPLKNISTVEATNQACTVTFKEKEYLHACPVCSGVAFHRPNEWPNRLHCQSSRCGVSVCFKCSREHSPSDYCVKQKPRLYKKLSPIKCVSTSPKYRSPRSRIRNEKALLKRL